MASVPNMRIVLPPAVPGAKTPVEGEGGDVFASLLSIVPSGETILDGPGTADGEASPTFDTQVRPATVDQEVEVEAGPSESGRAKGAETETGADTRDETVAVLAFTPGMDFLPILQAQNSFPVAATIVAAPSPMPLPTASVAQAPSSPQAAPKGAATNALDSAPRPAAPDTALRSKAAAKDEPEAAQLPTPLKAALKAAIGRAKPAQAHESPPDVLARKGGEARVESLKDGAAPLGQAAKQISAQSQTVQTPATQAPAQAPVASATIAAATEPALQPASVARSAPQMPQPADQAVERELDLAHESEWLDRLARDIVRSGSADGPMRFKLHPQTLGHLRVELTQGDQGTTVRLIAETEAARAIIADAQPRLLQEARAQGVRIAHAEVDLASTGHQASGDPRRQEDERQPNFIRTARDAGLDAAPAPEPGRANSDRYA